jgi:hypothetical protein
VNVRLEEALEPLCRLVAHRDEAEAVGAAGRSWMDRYWSDRELVRHYEEVYGDLLQDPSRVTRQEGLRIDGPAQRFFALTLPDLCWEARRRRSSPLSRLLFPRPGFGEEG